MRVTFLYNESTEDPALMAEEAEPARSAVVSALRRLGHGVTPIACTLDLTAVRRLLERLRPDVVFNRVESLGGSDAMMAAIPLLLETLQIPYTGCSGPALAATANKISVKRRLARAGLPTAAWITRVGKLYGLGPTSRRGDRCPRPSSFRTSDESFRFIIKSVFEHSSYEMSDESIIGPVSERDIKQLLRERESQCGRPFFAEQFIDGREFNISVLGADPEVLPPAEIDFSAFPVGKPHIVGYGAKCDVGCFEFHHTPRRFEFPAADGPLLRRLAELTARCWRLFDLDGYARVDFRCDASGQPWILEINTNPSLAPDAGFAAAMGRAGYEYDEALQRLLDDAMRCAVASAQAGKRRRRKPTVAS